jgi:hypothetical protein
MVDGPVARDRSAGGSPRVAPTVDALLAGAEDRELLVAADGKSGNWLERVTIGGQRFVVKHQSIAGDWLMRVAGDADYWPFVAWRAGVYDLVPPCIDHAVVAMALDGEGPDAHLAILLHDVGASLVPEGDEPVAGSDHASFLEHMAAMHAATWGWRDDLGLQTLEQRVSMFAPRTIASELLADDVPVPIAVADQGWARLPEVAPELAAIVEPLHADPTPIADALRSTPPTFLHGDWKMGNLGRHPAPDGRTVLLDWAYLGAGPGCWDLLWYLALNRARLPEPKEAAIDRYRSALAAAGVATDDWWDHQLAASTVAIMVAFAWEKAVGDADELAWWSDRTTAAARQLGW